jgi:hypothetical protein
MESTLAPEFISVTTSVEVISTKFLMSLDPASMLLADCIMPISGRRWIASP